MFVRKAVLQILFCCQGTCPGSEPDAAISGAALCTPDARTDLSAIRQSRSPHHAYEPRDSSSGNFPIKPDDLAYGQFLPFVSK
jgi:hypothetical protein